MPQRYGQRTNPYYPGGGQEVSPEILGGMAYNPYSERTDIGFALRNALNNLLATRQMQGAQAREEEERQKKELQQAFENEIKKRETIVKERLPQEPESPDIVGAKKLMQSDPIKYPNLGIALPEWFKIKKAETPPESLETLEKKEEIKGRIGAKYRQKPQLTDTQMRYAEIDKAVDNKWMTPQEGSMAKIKISDDTKNVARGSAARQANAGLAAKAYSDFFNSSEISGDEKKYTKYLRQMIKDGGGESPFTPDGYRLDMPRKYTVAQLNIEDEQADANDQDIVDLYDEMYKTFKEQILPSYRSFDDFMAAKDPQKDQLAIFLKKDPMFDKNQLKRWFELYAED